jgi:hypothetical protein
MRSYVALLREAKEFAKAQGVLQAALARDPKNDQVKGELIRAEADIGGMRAGLAKARTGVDPVWWMVCHLGRLGFLEHLRLVGDWG